MQAWACQGDLNEEVGSCLPAEVGGVIQGSEGFSRVRLTKYRAIWIKTTVCNMLQGVYILSAWLLCWLQAEQSLWHRQKPSIMALIRLICLLWLVFLFKMALIKMHWVSLKLNIWQWTARVSRSASTFQFLAYSYKVVLMPLRSISCFVLELLWCRLLRDFSGLFLLIARGG